MTDDLFAQFADQMAGKRQTRLGRFLQSICRWFREHSKPYRETRALVDAMIAQRLQAAEDERLLHGDNGPLDAQELARRSPLVDWSDVWESCAERTQAEAEAAQCQDAKYLDYTRYALAYSPDVTMQGVLFYANDTAGNSYVLHVTLSELREAVENAEAHEAQTATPETSDSESLAIARHYIRRGLVMMLDNLGIDWHRIDPLATDWDEIARRWPMTNAELEAMVVYTDKTQENAEAQSKGE